MHERLEGTTKKCENQNLVTRFFYCNKTTIFNNKSLHSSLNKANINNWQIN